MFELIRNHYCHCNQCNPKLNPMQYELRQIYDPALNPNMNCFHPGNYHMVSSSGGIDPPRRPTYLEATMGIKPAAPRPHAPTPKAKILCHAPQTHAFQYDVNKPNFNDNKFFEKSYKAFKSHKKATKTKVNHRFNKKLKHSHHNATSLTQPTMVHNSNNKTNHQQDKVIPLNKPTNVPNPKNKNENHRNETMSTKSLTKPAIVTMPIHFHQAEKKEKQELQAINQNLKNKLVNITKEILKIESKYGLKESIKRMDDH